LRFSFKAVGDYTRALPLLQRGTPVQVYGPFGHFTLHRLCRWRRMVWIGAGIGITPFLSMLAFEATNDDFRRIWLFHVVRRAQDAVYDGEIAQRIALADSWVDYVKWVSDERGPLTAHAVLASLGAFDDYAFMICGPPALARELKRQFEQRGVGSNRIVFEDFAFR
jgi:predicted ferric reductase